MQATVTKEALEFNNIWSFPESLWNKRFSFLSKEWTSHDIMKFIANIIAVSLQYICFRPDNMTLGD